MSRKKKKLRKVRKQSQAIEKEISDQKKAIKKRDIQRPRTPDEAKERKQEDRQIKQKQDKLGKLKSEMSKLQRQIKVERASKSVKLISAFGLPMILTMLGIILIISLLSSWMLISSTATIATLANPKYQAELKARGLLGNDQVTKIPKKMLGDEPDLATTDDAVFSKNEKSSGSDASDGKSAEENGQILYKHFKGKMSKARIAGLLGNFEHEAYLNPKTIEGSNGFGDANNRFKEAKKGNFDPRKLGIPANAGYADGHGGYVLGLGLAQWTGGRGYKLKNSSDDWYKMGPQLDFMDKEAYQGWNGKDSWKGWTSASKNSPADASIAFRTTYEGNTQKGVPESASMAEKWYNKIK